MGPALLIVENKTEYSKFLTECALDSFPLASIQIKTAKP